MPADSPPPGPPQAVLAWYLEHGRRNKGWSFDDFSSEARRQLPGLRGFSSRALADWAAGRHVKPPTLMQIRNLCRVLDLAEHSVLADVFPTDIGVAFYSKDHIIKQQKRLVRGHAVALVSCRRFLEVSDQEIRDMVVANLAEGVAYSYYFPPVGSAFGVEARDSYLAFRVDALPAARVLTETHILLSGFDLDPNRFPFFTPLQALVHYSASGLPDLHDQAWAYIETGTRSTGHWYNLPPENWKAIHSALARASGPISVRSTEACYALSSRDHSKSARRYVAWFRESRNLATYKSLRKGIGHLSDTVLAQLGELARDVPDAPQYLDVGCGDGEFTRTFAALLQEPIVTGLDPSPLQIAAARVNLRAPAHDFSGVETTLEAFNLPAEHRGFDVITAFHSLYFVDATYLLKLYDLLAPGGVAYVWMASREGDALSVLMCTLDKAQRHPLRHFAEDVHAFLSHNLGPRTNLRKAIIHSRAVDFGAPGKPTPVGTLAARFAGLVSPPETSPTGAIVAGVPKRLTDWLIRFTRPRP